jgi:hypothetical protein
MRTNTTNMKTFAAADGMKLAYYIERGGALAAAIRILGVEIVVAEDPGARRRRRRQAQCTAADRGDSVDPQAAQDADGASRRRCRPPPESSSSLLCASR